jgi:hypothetical protein
MTMKIAPLFTFFVLAALAGASAQQPAAPSAPTASCPVVTSTPSDADMALFHGKYEDAERLYTAEPPSAARTAGIVRTDLGLRHFDEALATIEKEVAAHPNDALLVDVLGEVRFRRGEVVQAAEAYNRSMVLDKCLARTHYDMGRFMNLNGLYLSAQKQWDKAHQLDPGDPVIDRTWEPTQRVPSTADQVIENLKKRLDDPALTEEQKTALLNSIKAVEAREKGDCTLAEPVNTAKIPLFPFNQQGSNARFATSSDVDVYLNGKRRRFTLDTGASGLLLSVDAARSLGLTPEASVTTGGIGDSGRRPTFITHLDSVKIGPMEFHNCMVRVLESKEALRVDGLIGADVFRSFVVTLDLPGNEIRLSPLPKRPDEGEAAATLGTQGDQDDSDSAPAQTIAQRKKDRYVPPEMANWQRIFRYGQYLIFPTDIGNAPRKLFVMDTGGGITLISADAAREVSRLTTDSSRKVRGLSGDVKNVQGTDDIAITFGNVRQIQRGGLSAIDTSAFSRGAGVELSGFIGYPLLRELVIQIDYRDNLVHLTYTPHVEQQPH